MSEVLHLGLVDENTLLLTLACRTNLHSTLGSWGLLLGLGFVLRIRIVGFRILLPSRILLAALCFLNSHKFRV